MKILLISSPTEKLYKGRSSYALGIAYLASCLEVNGHDVDVCDYYQATFNESKQLIMDKVRDTKPDIIGFSCLTLNRTSSRILCETIKNAYPEIFIVIGGVHVTALPEQTVINYAVDAVVIGEGEHTIVDLVNALDSGESLSNVQGIAYKDNGQVKYTFARPFCKDIDSLSFPKHDAYRTKILKEKWAYMITARGCPFSCQFCNSSQFWGRKVRLRSPDNIVEEIEIILKNFNNPSIMFHDDTFTVNKARLFSIVDKVIERKLNFEWVCSTRADCIDRETIQAMKSIGCKHVAIGVESGSEEILRSINKKITKPKIKKAFELLHDEGISAGIFLMVGNPGENEETVNDSIKLLKEIGTTDLQSPSILTIYPGTSVYELAKSKGIIDDDFWLSNKLAPYYTAEHTKQELLRMANRIALANMQKDGILNFFGKAFKLFTKSPIGLVKRVIKQYV